MSNLDWSNLTSQFPTHALSPLRVYTRETMSKWAYSLFVYHDQLALHLIMSMFPCPDCTQLVHHNLFAPVWIISFPIQARLSFEAFSAFKLPSFLETSSASLFYPYTTLFFKIHVFSFLILMPSTAFTSSSLFQKKFDLLTY